MCLEQTLVQGNSNIYDGSQYTADMAIHNVIEIALEEQRVSIHNGGGVGWEKLQTVDLEC